MAVFDGRREDDAARPLDTDPHRLYNRAMRVHSSLLPLLVSLLAACGGAGPFGFSPEYEPLSEEEAALEGVTPVGYEDVRRDVDGYAASKISWFGVVTGVDENAGIVELTYRTLAARNLCSDERDSSCRVTISARAGGPFIARIQFRPEEMNGSERIWNGSLLRIVGSPEPQLGQDEMPVIVGSYHRHWPRGAYVTTNARGAMRR